MAIIRQRNKKTGVTYVYESYSYRDKETKQPRAKRKLIGRIDEETGEVVPTRRQAKNITAGSGPAGSTQAEAASSGSSPLDIILEEKISEWMYQAYRKQSVENLPDEEALQLIFDRLGEEKIRIPDYEIVNRYRAEKDRFRKRFAGENVPQRIYAMESILDKATRKMDVLEKKIEEYEAFQTEIRRLEAYYTSPQWKEDFAADEAGKYPDELKRGVLSQDGIWNMLERNRELTQRIGIPEAQGHDEPE